MLARRSTARTGGGRTLRLEYTFELDHVDVPRFAVEAVEGIGKLFTLATLVMNVCAQKDRVEVIFHGLNPEDPTRKIEAFRQILATAEAGAEMIFEAGQGGQIEGSSSYFRWLILTKP